MTRRWALVGSLAFLLLVPGTVAGVVPWWISRWQLRPAFLGLSASRVAGAVLVVAGVAALLESFARFALRGRGTPAPLLPTQRLVVSGLYRHVRNPMYVAVVSVILGQGLVLADARVIGYAAAIWTVFHLFVLGYEEPALRRSFGAEYERYRASVPRWVPRVRPWRAG
jgi:protein-S-isoprenylcysteine O-methyltransferase Ste14